MADNESNHNKQQHVKDSLDAMLEKTEDRINRLHCDLLDAKVEKEWLLRSKAMMVDNESNCNKQQHVKASLDAMLEKTEDQIKRLSWHLLEAELKKERLLCSKETMAENESNHDKQQNVKEMLQSGEQASLDAMIEKTKDQIKRLRCDLFDAELDNERLLLLRDLFDAELENEGLLCSKPSSEENHE
jgi:acid stress-induced BolA-like protein IbaG/YrbA